MNESPELLTEVAIEWARYRFSFGRVGPGIWKAHGSMVEAVPSEVTLSFVDARGSHVSMMVGVPDYITQNLGGNVLDFAIRPDQEVVVSMRALHHKR